MSAATVKRQGSSLAAYGRSVGSHGIMWALCVEVPVLVVWAVIWALLAVAEIAGRERVAEQGRREKRAAAEEAERVREEREARRSRVAREGRAQVLAETLGVDLESAAPEAREELDRQVAGALPAPGWWRDPDDDALEVWWNGVALTDVTRRRMAGQGRGRGRVGVARPVRAPEVEGGPVGLAVPHGAALAAESGPVGVWETSGALVDVSVDEGVSHVDLTGEVAGVAADVEEARILGEVELIDRADSLRRHLGLQDSAVVDIAEQLHPGAAETPWAWDLPLWRLVVSRLESMAEQPPVVVHRQSRRDTVRAELEDYRQAIFTAAEDECSGYLVDARGRERGVDAWRVVTDVRSFDAYASEELRGWALDHHYRPLTVGEWMEAHVERREEVGA